MPEPLLGQAQKTPLVRTIEQDLGHGQADQLAIGDPRRPTKAPSSGRQEIIDQHVKADQQSVEVGGHNRPPWSTVMDTADFGARLLWSLRLRNQSSSGQ